LVPEAPKADHGGSKHGEGLLMLVLVEVDDRVATVTLNRPEARNAISGELHALLDETITGLDVRDDIGCIVLTGADPAFCAGMDLKSLATELREVQKERQRGPAQRSGMMPPHDTPVIGAINGATVTGGLELAMCCDFLIASERARFADTHARVGVMPGGGMTIRLPQLVGLDRARRMSLTGDYIDAETARDWGLVVEVVPHEALLARAREVAATIAGIPAEYLTELRRGYDEIGALSGRAAFVAEAKWSRAWMAERFDQSRLTTEREKIVARGRAQTAGPGGGGPG
jgi:enoyl-CoA hydratase